jgi:hypothetical protein
MNSLEATGRERTDEEVMRRGRADGRSEMRIPRCLPVPNCLSTERIGGKRMKVTALVPVVLTPAVATTPHKANKEESKCRIGL